MFISRHAHTLGDNLNCSDLSPDLIVISRDFFCLLFSLANDFFEHFLSGDNAGILDVTSLFASCLSGHATRIFRGELA